MSVLNSFSSLGAALQDEVVGPGLVVVQEEILDRRGAVPEAEDEIGVAEMGVVAHDVPEQRALPDQRHRLGAVGDAIAHPHPEATAEQDDFHDSHLHSDDLELRDRERPGAPPHDRT